MQPVLTDRHSTALDDTHLRASCASKAGRNVSTSRRSASCQWKAGSFDVCAARCCMAAALEVVACPPARPNKYLGYKKPGDVAANRSCCTLIVGRHVRSCGHIQTGAHAVFRQEPAHQLVALMLAQNARLHRQHSGVPSLLHSQRTSQSGHVVQSNGVLDMR